MIEREVFGPKEVSIYKLFTGGIDFLCCFCCGGGLRSWTADDDPYIEHARWFPHCSYLREVMGQEYINMVQQALADVQAEVGTVYYRIFFFSLTFSLVIYLLP